MTRTNSPSMTSRPPADRIFFEPGTSTHSGGDAALERQTMRKISLRLLPLLFAPVHLVADRSHQRRDRVAPDEPRHRP
jgi:hypothetical protein